MDSAEKADVVLLLSAKEYISGYSSGSYHNMTGNVDSNGNVNAQTYGNSTSQAIVSATRPRACLRPADISASLLDVSFTLGESRVCLLAYVKMSQLLSRQGTC